MWLSLLRMKAKLTQPRLSDKLSAKRQMSTSTTASTLPFIPFEAKNTNKSKQALFYRDFYRGALLAVNDLKTKSKLNLYAYDITDANISTVLSKKEIANAHMILPLLRTTC